MVPQVEPVAGQGMLVTRVSPQSPGELQGIRKDDVIHKLNGILVPTLKIWLKCLKDIAPGNIAVVVFKKICSTGLRMYLFDFDSLTLFVELSIWSPL